MYVDKQIYPEKAWLGIKIKQQFGFSQWLVLPMMNIGTVFVGVYMNTQLSYMLIDPNMFSIDKDQIGTVSSNLVVYSIPFTMLALYFVSYAFEFLGRRLTIFFSFITTAALFCLIPRMAPSYSWLMVVRCLIAITMAGPLSHPLIPDYVHKSSRGKAVALTAIGTVFGEILAICIFKVNIFFEMTFFDSFTASALLIALLAVYYYLSIKDPDLKKLHKNLEQLSITLLKKSAY